MAMHLKGMQMSTATTETNRSPADLSARDIAAILANPTEEGIDELYQWMDAAEAELGHQDPRVAQHDEVYDVAINGLANVLRMSPHDQVERMLAAQLVAAHSATIDCYRRARTANLEQRSENLRHADRLTRAFTMLTRALQRNRAEADDRGVARPSPDAEPLPRERGPVRRHGARRAAGMARRFFAEQPHAKAPPRNPAPAAPPAAEAPGPAPDANSVEQPHAKGAGAKSAEQPYAKAAAASGGAQTPPAATSEDRPWADPARWGRDPRAGRHPRNNVQRGPGAKREK
jgi:hypothetical protein